jgi:hypothetical protein
MKNIKHIGRMKNNGAKILVAFRTLPGESDHALIIPVSSLSDSYHDSIMSVVESDQAQDVFEFGEILHIRYFSDGRPMLISLQQDGKLTKVPTDQVVMTPNTENTIMLNELNALIAEQKNCAIDDLCSFVKGAPQPEKSRKNEIENLAEIEDLSSNLTLKEPEILDDKSLARSYRSQADTLYKEAAKLRKQADELDPPQKKTLKSKEVSEI